MAVRSSYTVTIRAAETIAPVETRPEHRLPMSNFDLALPPVDFGVFFCYDKTMRSFDEMVAVLSMSLAQALSTYYPLSGEFVANPLGEPEVLCNGRGVDFAAAYADVELRELALGYPDDSVEGKLMPKKKAGVFCVQATGLKCGGLVVACKFDHRVADAYSANMFLVFWSELATFGHAARLPSFCRTLLSPRLPLRLHPSIDRILAPISSFPPPPSNPPIPADLFVSRIYYITNADIVSLQSSTHGRTKVEAFTAYLWRALAKAAEAEGERWCRIGTVVDGRTRLSASMGNYFGNVLSLPFGNMEVAELRGMGLGEMAERVSGWLRPAATEDHFRALVDWVEAHRPEPAVARIYLGEAEGGLACMVSSGRAFPVKEVDFGWGKPAFGSYHFPWAGIGSSTSGYVMPMPSARGNGDWIVYAHLQKSVVAVLEAEQPTVFRPLTPDYYLTDIN